MRQHALASFADLMRRSTEDIPWFTQAILNFLDIRFLRALFQGIGFEQGDCLASVVRGWQDEYCPQLFG